ncbi:GntR family transcriptional regulator [Paracandidimonas soli]|uniref:GntR family transcriptional regulator n=1 Tax=Paracandidimonas soli TaxID=1917182 RepID=UPI00333E212D
MNAVKTAKAAGKPLKNMAYDALEDLLIRGKLPGGTMLSEAELAEQLGLGRTPVREAVQRLAQEGLINILPRKGLMVVDMSVTRQLQALEVRRPLERLLASCASHRANPEQRARMLDYARTTEETGAAGDGSQFLAIIKRNHALLEEASGNELIQSVMALVHARSRRFWFSHAQALDLKTASKLHSALLRSVSVGDEAESLANADRLVNYLEDFCRSTIAVYQHSGTASARPSSSNT